MIADLTGVILNSVSYYALMGEWELRQNPFCCVAVLSPRLEDIQFLEQWIAWLKDPGEMPEHPRQRHIDAISRLLGFTTKQEYFDWLLATPEPELREKRLVTTYLRLRKEQIENPG